MGHVFRSGAIRSGEVVMAKQQEPSDRAKCEGLLDIEELGKVSSRLIEGPRLHERRADRALS
jgi:hypothetical protein